MFNKKVHDYFKRKTEEWYIVDFLKDCDEEPLKRKIDIYIKSLETIMNTEQEPKRRDKAKVLYDNYKKASKKVFTGNKNGGVAKVC